MPTPERRRPPTIRQGDDHLIAALGDIGHHRAECQLAAPLADNLAHHLGNRRVVDDSGRGDEQCAHTPDVRLASMQLAGIEPLDLDVIGVRPRVERVHAGQLGGVGRHEQLAAHVYRYPVPGGEVFGGLGPLPAQPGLEAARCVINAGVDDPAVVPGLMRPERQLLVDQAQAGAGLAVENRHRRGEADDAPADDAIVVTHPSPRGGLTATVRAGSPLIVS